MNQAFIVLALAVVIVVVLLLSTKKKAKPEPTPADSMDVKEWEVGPIYDGENVSKGVNLHAVEGGWAMDIPQAGTGSVHYVTMPTASLAGKTKVTLVCELVMAEGVKLCPVKSPDAPSLLTLYFQRRRDNWSGVGEYETYRWYAGGSTRGNLKAQEYVLEAKFSDDWGAVQTSLKATQPEAFNDALENASRIGFVLGGGDGLGHGVYATGPAKLVIKSFTVE